MGDKVKWAAVDLDGTLAVYEPGVWPDIGPMIPEVAQHLRGWLAAGNRASIFTSRLHGTSRDLMIVRIQRWLVDNNLPRLEVTDVKHPKFTEFWDDKAVRVMHNEGEFCEGLCDER